MFSIYTINDLLTGMIRYVGMTSQPLEKRLKQHATKRSCPMYPVIHEIGPDNIEIKGIDTAATKKEAHALEAEWTIRLEEGNDLINTDYGSKLGESHINHIRETKTGMPCPWARKAVRCIETGEVYDSISIASEETGTNKSSISKCLTGRAKSAGGFHWSYSD